MHSAVVFLATRYGGFKTGGFGFQEEGGCEGEFIDAFFSKGIASKQVI
jgi:hypothetical protein